MAETKDKIEKQESLVYKGIRTALEGLDTNVTQMCKEIGIERTMMDRWRKNEPKAISTLRKIEKFIKDKRKAQAEGSES